MVGVGCILQQLPLSCPFVNYSTGRIKNANKPNRFDVVRKNSVGRPTLWSPHFISLREKESEISSCFVVACVVVLYVFSLPTKLTGTHWDFISQLTASLQLFEWAINVSLSQGIFAQTARNYSRHDTFSIACRTRV